MRIQRSSLLVVFTITVALFLTPIASADDVTLKFWHAWGGPNEADMREVMDLFEARNPGIRVEIEVVPWDMQVEKMMTSVISGNPPSVLTTDNMYVLALAAQGVLEPLDRFMNDDPLMSKEHFYKGLYEGSIYQDQTWSVIWNGGTMVHYWNRDIYREVGLDPESPPSTWDDLIEYTDKINIQNEDGRFSRVGFVPTYNAPFFVFGWLNGGEWFEKAEDRVTAAHPKNVEALQWTLDFYDRYGSDSLRAFEGGFGSQADSPFYVGQLGSYIGGSWDIGNMRRFAADVDYGVSGQLPVPEGGQQTGFFWGNALVMPSGVDHPEEAWKLIRFLTTDGNLEWFKRKGEHFTYNNPDFIDHPELQELYASFPGMREAFDALPNSRPLMMPVGPLYMNDLDSAVSYAVSKQKTAQQALEDVERRVQRELDSF